MDRDVVEDGNGSRSSVRRSRSFALSHRPAVPRARLEPHSFERSRSMRLTIERNFFRFPRIRNENFDAECIYFEGSNSLVRDRRPSRRRRARLHSRSSGTKAQETEKAIASPSSRPARKKAGFPSARRTRRGVELLRVRGRASLRHPPPVQTFWGRFLGNAKQERAGSVSHDPERSCICCEGRGTVIGEDVRDESRRVLVVGGR